uniref:hypothetical protein n=1 Tax=Prevotella sp. TaxID=59823 RepID=UPI003FEEC269
MENYFRKCRLLPAMTLLGGLALASCVNSDYDFNEVDATMGFGGEGRVSPKSRLQSLLSFSVLCTQFGQSKQEEWNVSYSPELAPES